MTGLSPEDTFAALCLVDGCDDCLRAAVERFSLLYEGESSRSNSWSPQEALACIVFEAWENYIKHLSIPFLDEQLAPFHSLNLAYSLHSSEVMRAVDNHLCRSWDRLQCRSTELRRLLEAESRTCATDHFEEDSLVREWWKLEEKLRASIDTMRSVLFQSRILLSPTFLRLRRDVSPIVEESASHSGPQPKRMATKGDSWFHGTLSRSWLSRRFGEPTHVEEDQDFPKFCAFTSRGVPCERLTEYEAYRRGETCDADSWQGLRVLRIDRCAEHPHNAKVVPTCGESSSAELAHFVHAESKFMTTHPKTGPFGEVVSEPHKRTCRLCSRRTELWAALREGKAFSRDLSSNFCRHHRSQQKDGKWERPDGQGLDSSTYESRANKVHTFSLEFARLHAHAAHRIEPIRTAESAYPDLFVSNIIRATELVKCKHFELSRLAWQIVECNLDDRKKEIVMRLCCKESQASIARELGTSRQNIGRILTSIPSYFKFSNLASEDALSLRDKIAAAKLLSDSPIRKNRKHSASVA